MDARTRDVATTGVQPLFDPGAAMLVPDHADPQWLRDAVGAAQEAPATRSRRHLERLAAFAALELAGDLAAGLDATIQRIAESVHPLVPNCGGISVVLFDAEADGFVTSASTVPGQAHGEASARVRRKSGATRYIVDTGLPLYVRDTRRDPFVANRMLSETGNNAYVGVPIWSPAEVVGVLYGLSPQIDNFTAEDVAFLQLVADRAAVVIQAAQQFRRVERLGELDELVSFVARRLAEADDPGQDLGDVVERVAEVLELDTLVVLPAGGGSGAAVVAGSDPAPTWTLLPAPRVEAQLRPHVRSGRAHVAQVTGSAGALQIALRGERPLSDDERACLDRVAALASTMSRRADDIARYRASNAALERFALTLSHDLRSPLNSIAGLVDVLLHTEGHALSTGGRDSARRAAEIAHRMATTLDSLLAQARFDARELQIRPTPLVDLLQAVREDLHEDLVATGATIVHDVLPVVHVDRAAFHLVLQNLVANAVKFQRDGVPPWIEVRAHVGDQRVRIEVVDEGPGVPPEDRERVFGLMQRGATGTTGTGVGLATVASVVERHGGRVWLEANEPFGTVAVVDLPRRPAGA